MRQVSKALCRIFLLHLDDVFGFGSQTQDSWEPGAWSLEHYETKKN